MTLYERVAMNAAKRWNTNGQMGLVVGATFPEEIAKVRNIVGDMPLLVPGIGAQGGDVLATVLAGQGKSLIINSSRAILYASNGEDFMSAARQVALKTRDEINQARAQCA
jgi:orotidine-5'-phosphate decarboxylase